MGNQTNLSDEQINKAVSDLQRDKKDGMSIDEMIDKRLSPEQAQAVRQVLSDPEKMKKILSSPFAKKFFQSIKNKEQGDV